MPPKIFIKIPFTFLSDKIILKAAEYGVKGIFAGVPVIIGKDGVEKIEEINLDEKEKNQFMHSIEAVKKLWDAASKIDKDLSK